MYHHKFAEASLISLRNIAELKQIKLLNDGSVSIGALVTFSQLEKNQVINKYHPILKTAGASMGGPQIRNVATIGGNICNGATSADSAPSLLALDAKLKLENLNDSRLVPITDFYLGPSKVALNPGEILSEIIIPSIENVKYGGHYIKFSMRKAMDISTLGCAAVCQINEAQEIITIGIALGTASPTPIRCKEAERLLLGKKPTEELLAGAGIAASGEAFPRTSWRASKEYRHQLIKELTIRTLEQAFKNSGGEVIDAN